MTRLYIKGGTWKNSEDEILKAGVMKYGKNQWARIASLLNRKSAKQCKARWNEWLDPSIKKTEWTREEEEKLLHLAKIMPTQWRTIAPMVGRTASQCLEHYERLLDQAQERDKDYDPNDDPRKLRPGEIDPSPETKPAKPDTVHMDEDEKEMLSEARARLANTKGKKEKRKARERQLEEARRIATIQKRRELKAAGVHLAPSRYRQKKKSAKRNENSMNPNAEIPFFRPPPPGFFDTTEEILKSKEEEQKINKEALLAFEANRDAREQKEKEAEEQKNEKKKKKKSLVLPKPAVNLFEQTTVKRSKLTLPKPQISDVELEEIGKLSSHATPVFGSGSATDKLLTPKPNAGVTPGGTTPYRSTGLKLNNVEVSNARAQEFYKKQLLEKLQTIPAPLTNATFQSAPINYEKEDELMKDITEDDLGEIKRKKAEQIKERRVLKLKRRSQPVQRNLPRPSKFDPTFKSKVVGTTDPTAEDLISKEMQLLLTHDAEKYPIEGISKKGRKSSINLEKIANNIMQQAREILEIEKTKFKSPSVEQYSQIWEKSVQVILPSDTSVLHQVYAEERQKSQKQEQKLTIFTGGYMKRLQSLTEEIKKVSQEIAERTRERNSFEAMQELEHNAIRSRESKLSEDLYQLRLEQQKLQQNYQELVQEKQQLENSLRLNVSVQNPQN